jgi:hypothetical protein
MCASKQGFPRSMFTVPAGWPPVSAGWLVTGHKFIPRQEGVWLETQGKFENWGVHQEDFEVRQLPKL